MNKNRIRLNESQLREIVRESVKNILSELSSGTVKNTIDKMKMMGANERAQHIGDLAVNNYGGKDLSDAGFTAAPRGNKMQIGRLKNQMYRGRNTGSESGDIRYDNDIEQYNNLSPLKKMFTKKPQMPKDYGKPSWIDSGRKEFMPSIPKTNDPRIARQAAKFQKWTGDDNARTSNFRK